jgi:two-component system, LytTR family, response regulator
MSIPVLRTLLVDDEPVARQILREELAELPGVEVQGEAENGAQALVMIEALRPDLVLLDIQMPALDGFEVVRRISGPLPSIVFVTAFSEHALRAFEVGAADYLLKPVRADRLRHAIERVRESRGSPADSAQRVARTIEAAENERAPGAVRKVVARRGHDYYLLDLSEVFAFQAEGEIVWIHTENQRYMATQTLQAIEERLRGGPFQRVHRGALVNADKIRKMSSLSSQRWLLTLTNGLQMTVSKRQAPVVRGLLG